MTSTLIFRNSHRLIGAVLMALAAMVLSGCFETPTANPDYRIAVMPAETADNGYVAIPPVCADWRTYGLNPLDNQPFPNFGCANQRNLAMLIDDPQDLLRGQEMGPTDAKKAINGIHRYRWDVTYGLEDLSQEVFTIRPETTVEKTP